MVYSSWFKWHVHYKQQKLLLLGTLNTSLADVLSTDTLITWHVPEDWPAVWIRDSKLFTSWVILYAVLEVNRVIRTKTKHMCMLYIWGQFHSIELKASFRHLYRKRRRKYSALQRIFCFICKQKPYSFPGVYKPKLRVFTSRDCRWPINGAYQ